MHDPSSRTGRRTLPLLAAATILYGATAASEGRGQAIGQLVEIAPRPLPRLSFTDAEGTERVPEMFHGRGLVVNLWATWCAPCIAELPSLDRLAAAVAGDGILVLPLSSDRGGAAQVRSFYERIGIRRLGIWLDPRGAAARALSVRGLPTTLIVDRAGREVARLEGEAAWDSPALIAALYRLVGGSVAEPPRQT
jgi:thiol-disulfide isomerase/thioredoxin